MTSPGPRFCPRCGTARVADMPFCPGCGLNAAAYDEPTVLEPDARATPTDVASRTSTAPAVSSQSSWFDDWEAGRPSASTVATATRPSVDRGFRVPPVVIVAVIVVGGLMVLGLLPQLQPGASPGSGDPPRPQPAGSPGSVGQPPSGVASTVPVPLIVGLTILSPTDGQAVATRELTVIGTAPPGLTITQDVTFGFDQHATADGTGHWAIKVGLNEGDNKLTFRIGDDNSTKQTIRVIYMPPPTP